MYVYTCGAYMHSFSILFLTVQGSLCVCVCDCPSSMYGIPINMKANIHTCVDDCTTQSSVCVLSVCSVAIARIKKHTMEFHLSKIHHLPKYCICTLVYVIHNTHTHMHNTHTHAYISYA